MAKKLWLLTINLAIVFLLLFGGSLQAQEPESEEATWAKAQKLLVEPDDNRDALFQILDAYRAAFPEGAHNEEAALWLIKITTDFKDPNTARFIEILEGLSQNAAQTEVRSESLFWKAHILYSTGGMADGLTGFRQYLERFSDGPRAAQVRMFLELETKIEDARKGFLENIHATLAMIAQQKMFEIGLRVRLYPDSLDARIAMTAGQGSSIRAASPWVNFNMYSGAEGLFVFLPDEKRLLRFSTDLHLMPTLVWNADQINIGFTSTAQIASTTPTVDVKTDDVIPVLAERLATLHLSQSGRDFKIYETGLLPPIGKTPGFVFSFDQQKHLANVMTYNRKGEKRVEISEITFIPKPDKSPMVAAAKQVQEMTINDVSLANAGRYIFETLEKQKSRVTDYDQLMQSKPMVMALLSQLDGILSLVRNAVTDEQELARLDAQMKTQPSDPTRLQRRAELLTALRRFDDAQKAIAEVKTAQGDSPAVKLLEAEYMIAKNEVSQARDLLGAAIVQYPENGALLARYAELLFFDNASEAMRLAARALELDPTLTNAYKFLASVYLKVGMNEEADRVLNTGIQKAAAPDELRNLKGLIFFNDGRYGEAMEAIKPVLAGPPTDNTPMAKMIELMVNLKKADGGASQ